MKGIFERQTMSSSLGFMIKEYHQAHFTSPFHFHDVYELALIVKSDGKLYAGNNVINFEDGDLFLFGPGFPHCFFNDRSFLSSGETAHAIVAFFKEDFLGKDFFSNRELMPVQELMRKSAYGLKLNQHDDQLLSLMKEITKRKGMDALVIMLQLLNRLSKQIKSISLINKEIFKSDVNDADSTKLDPVMKYVIENFKDNLQSKVAASLACMNEASFCRYFKSRTEQTFSQFVNQVRIAHAIHLLASEEQSITNICFECGFQNISYFNRQFKAITGQTPMLYRKSLLYPENDVVAQTEE